jgi:pimeloyl-ACP methyl ester carboxylesterase
MSTILIVLLVLIGAVLAASVALGRVSHEVESARDTEYLELEGTWIRYRVMGGGPPVLLVHGWLSSSRIWEQLAGRLAQRFTVYTLDLSGFGESDKPLSGYGVRSGSRLLYAFCAHFGLTRTNIIGHDLGGNMAVKLAADHPDLVGRPRGYPRRREPDRPSYAPLARYPARPGAPLLYPGTPRAARA